MLIDFFKSRKQRKRQEKQIIQDFLDSYGIDEEAFNSLISKAIDNHLDSYVLWRFASLIGDALYFTCVILIIVFLCIIVICS